MIQIYIVDHLWIPNFQMLLMNTWIKSLIAFKCYHLSSLFIVLLCYIYKRTQNLYDRFVWRLINYFSLLFSYIERKVKRFRGILFIWITSGGSSGIGDVVVKISLANTELRSATPFIHVVLLKTAVLSTVFVLFSATNPTL